MNSVQPNSHLFLKNDGEMSKLIRAYKWQDTAIGPIDGWSTSLKVTLENLLHSAFPMFLFWSDDLICFYNDAFRPSLGASGKHPAIGKKGIEVWSEIWHFIGPLIQQVMTTGEPVWYADQLVPFMRNGKVEDIYWTFSYSPAYADDGRICGVLVTCMETTNAVLSRNIIEETVANRTKELKEAHESLRKANSYLQTIINLFKEPLQVLEPVFANDTIVDFAFKLTNQAYANYAGTTPELLAGKKVGEIFPGYFDTASFTKPVETFQSGKPDTFEIHYDKDGLDLYNLMSTEKLGDEVIVHFTDFTELKHLQLELIHKIEELERSNRQLEEFAHATSHDLKEPTRKILVFINQLKHEIQERLNQGELKTFERIESAANRMRALIDDLLTYSQLHQKPQQKEQIDLNEVMKQVMMDLDLIAAQKGAKIVYQNLPAIKGYERQLQQAFLNLVNNAIKYARHDLAPVITVNCTSSSEEGKKYHLIEVADNGIGFEPEYSDKIFQMFARLHDKTKYEGTGIGLSIVKKIIENHDGVISVESKPNVGSKFKIKLPIQ
jgi:signal transduction histidine kinase